MQCSLRVGAWLESGPPALAGISQMARQAHYDWVQYAFGPSARAGAQRVSRACRAAGGAPAAADALEALRRSATSLAGIC